MAQSTGFQPTTMHCIVEHPTCQSATIICATSGTQPPKQTELQASRFNRHGGPSQLTHDNCTWGAPRPHEQAAPKLPWFFIQQAERGRIQALRAVWEGRQHICAERVSAKVGAHQFSAQPTL